MLKSFLKVSLISVPITVSIFDQIGLVCKVEGSSMKPLINPTKNVKNFVFLKRWQYDKFNYERGDVVCLWCPLEPSQKILKRIVALEGDTVSTKNYKEETVVIPKGYCWVEGDNQKNSLDSNVFGPIPKGLIHSKATHIVWPLNSIQKIPPKNMEHRIQNHDFHESFFQANFENSFKDSDSITK